MPNSGVELFHPQTRIAGISNSPIAVIPSEARNLLFTERKKQILRPTASE
jgi:hypothetical protein